ncbi:hypothetical protein [Larsenimonas rhizosphaerae]|uniref:hypothetical protein n=1 Tax=Larsenimonas rhizosphaerae TaxID=2944682 RepID=UPI002034859F|nr:hypothetical protein [Larsenimonas rhizosphaerae]MCM2131851.1 hypothetical protein [Larsenimonas rhizosphaerae]
MSSNFRGWSRRGVLISPESLDSAWSGHCQMPTPLLLENGLLRIFFCSRDRRNESHILWADVENSPPWRMVRMAPEPVLSPSGPGLFDAAGVMPSSIVRWKNRLLMYTIGWTVRTDVPYHNAIGLCESFDGGLTWERSFSGPVISQGKNEPFFCGTSEVVVSDGKLDMYYMSATEWRTIQGKSEPRYNIRHSVSRDGVEWRKDNPVVVDYKNNNEGGIARATLMSYQKNTELMFYCHRGIDGYRSGRQTSYKIGYSSRIGENPWVRNESKSVFVTSPGSADFDSEMECYPFVYGSDDSFFMFYNGNFFGKSGIGWAEME